MSASLIRTGNRTLQTILDCLKSYSGPYTEVYETSELFAKNLLYKIDQSFQARARLMITDNDKVKKSILHGNLFTKCTETKGRGFFQKKQEKIADLEAQFPSSCFAYLFSTPDSTIGKLADLWEEGSVPHDYISYVFIPTCLNCFLSSEESNNMYKFLSDLFAKAKKNDELKNMATEFLAAFVFWDFVFVDKFVDTFATLYDERYEDKMETSKFVDVCLESFAKSLPFMKLSVQKALNSYQETFKKSELFVFIVNNFVQNKYIMRYMNSSYLFAGPLCEVFAENKINEKDVKSDDESLIDLCKVYSEELNVSMIASKYIRTVTPYDYGLVGELTAGQENELKHLLEKENMYQYYEVETSFIEDPSASKKLPVNKYKNIPDETVALWKKLKSENHRGGAELLLSIPGIKSNDGTYIIDEDLHDNKEVKKRNDLLRCYLQDLTFNQKMINNLTKISSENKRISPLKSLQEQQKSGDKVLDIIIQGQIYGLFEKDSVSIKDNKSDSINSVIISSRNEAFANIIALKVFKSKKLELDTDIDINIDEKVMNLLNEKLEKESFLISPGAIKLAIRKIVEADTFNENGSRVAHLLANIWTSIELFCTEPNANEEEEINEKYDCIIKAFVHKCCNYKPENTKNFFAKLRWFNEKLTNKLGSLPEGLIPVAKIIKEWNQKVEKSFK